MPVRVANDEALGKRIVYGPERWETAGRLRGCYLPEFGSCFELEAAFCCAALVLPDDTWAALVSVPPSMPAAKIANTKRVAVAPTRRAALLMPIMRKWISLNPLQGLGYELRSLLMLLHQASEELSFSIAINAKPS